MYRFLLFVVLALALAGCAHKESDHLSEKAHHHHEHGRNITQWSQGYELFMEHAPLIVNEPVDFTLHLTRLSDFSPVQQADVQVIFENVESGSFLTFPGVKTRSGIFMAHVELERSGHYHAEIEMHADKAVHFHLGHVDVFASKQEMENDLHTHDPYPATNAQDEHAQNHAGHNHAEENAAEHDHQHVDPAHNDEYAEDNLYVAGDPIFFSKEQQWQTAFAVDLVEKREIQNSILAIANILPHQQGYAEVVAPVDGFLDVQLNRSLVTPGSLVKKGQELAVLSPPIGASNTIVERVLSYERALKDFDRAQALQQRDAISQREFEQIEKIYMLEKTAFETLAESYGLAVDGQETQIDQFKLRAPISGVLTEMLVLPGQNVTAGQKMMTIIDPASVWVRADLFERDFYQLGDISGLSLTVQATSQKLNFSENEFELLSKGQQIDSETRTIPVLLQVRNMKNILKIGQIVQAEIYSSDKQTGLVVPASAIMDEEVYKIVYVQTGGEMFEPRFVETGSSFYGWVSISSGLQAGERIVSKGAYAVKLASTNVSVGHGHVH